MSRRMRMPSGYAWVKPLVLAAVVLAYAGFRAFSGQQETSAADSVYYAVSRVVDGDTLKLSNNERVRLIGVDTPEVHQSSKLMRDARKSGKDVSEIQALGARASTFTKSLCEGKKVRLEFDVERRDRYGRTLAYVYLEDGTFVNAKIIEEGYAQVMTIPPNVKHADLFLKAQKEARESGRGLWKK